jgi:guanosine-3',5'-bis(diphosphate) 3'-pyrophosphohydrolase
LFGPNGIPIEVQIRTEDMHRVAEAGIAAHWKYKVNDSEGGQDERAREWLANLVDMQEGGSSEDFLESVKVDLFPDKVYVFTPKGEILRLPRGATVVDFAYAVHTDVGNRCVAAKVDRRLTPLRTPLRNGQTVEIITAKGAMPNPSWVNFVVTAKARAAVRHYLKGLRRQEAIELGARLINQALGEFKMSLDEVAADTLNSAVVELGMHDVDELYEKVGLGERLAPLVARRLLPTKATEESFSGAPAPLAIAGTEGLLVSYARCCFPIPDDAIFAFLSAGRGVVVHRENCVNVEDYRKHPENWLPVAWQATTDKLFSSEIRVDVANKMGVLAAVAAAISSGDTNIERVAVEEKDADSSSLVFELRVRNREHLARVVKVIRRMPEVLKVTRTIASHGRSRATE